MADFFGHAISCIDEDVSIGVKTKIRHCCQVQRGARIGTGCSPVCEGVELEDDVFCGASCAFANDLTPRSKVSVKQNPTFQTS